MSVEMNLGRSLHVASLSSWFVEVAAKMAHKVTTLLQCIPPPPTLTFKPTDPNPPPTDPNPPPTDPNPPPTDPNPPPTDPNPPPTDPNPPPTDPNPPPTDPNPPPTDPNPPPTDPNPPPTDPNPPPIDPNPPPTDPNPPPTDPNPPPTDPNPPPTDPNPTITSPRHPCSPPPTAKRSADPRWRVFGTRPLSSLGGGRRSCGYLHSRTAGVRPFVSPRPPLDDPITHHQDMLSPASQRLSKRYYWNQ
ncbi:uncharacterized protein [Procambarus clarkii]|uniref:uncharacterized protein n=1 Tax=Procambarus clarkii TaxID=6728 RepID=UPI003743536A